MSEPADWIDWNAFWAPIYADRRELWHLRWQRFWEQVAAFILYKFGQQPYWTTWQRLSDD